MKNQNELSQADQAGSVGRESHFVGSGTTGMSLHAVCWGILCVWLAVVGNVTSVTAHPISISDAYVEIQPDQLQVRIEVFVEDLYLFHELPLNSRNELTVEQIEKGMKLHEQFLLDRFKILQANGEKLTGQLVRINPEDLPGRSIPFGQLMFFRIFYEFEYPVTEPPEFLTFLHEFTNEKMILPAEVQVKVKPLQGRRFQQVLLPEQPWTIRLNGTGSASAEDQKMSPLERFEQMREETLGITSYGETYAFLYLEEHEVRLEILVPLATLARSLEKDFPLDGLLEVEDQQELKAPVEELLKTQLQLSLDGQIQTAHVERLNFFGVAFRDFSQNTSPKAVSVANARVGVILSYPRPATTTSGRLEWGLFNPFLYQVRLTVIEGENVQKELLQQELEPEPESAPSAVQETTPETGPSAEQEPAPQVKEDPNVTPVVYEWEFSPKSALPETAEAELATANQNDRALLAVTVPESQLPRQIGIMVLICWGIGAVVFFIFYGRLVRSTPEAGRKWSRIAFGICFLFCLSAGVMVGLANSVPSLFVAEQQPLLDPPEAKQVTQQLLNSIYTAFNQREETEIYAQLEEVVDGPLLRDLYLEIRRSMTLEEQGGAVARAGAPDLISCEGAPESTAVTPEPYGQVVKCVWEVPGTVEHWGHIHQRTTSYLGEITVAPRPMEEENHQQWKVIAVKLLNQDQSAIQTSVRQF